MTDKKMCPILSMTTIQEKNGAKPTFSCIGEKCMWYLTVDSTDGGHYEMCAIKALVMMRVQGDP